MSLKSRRLVVAQSASVVALLAGMAMAPVAHADADAALAKNDNSNTIEELIVTAEKREQNLQKVPVAISAYTSEQRELRGISTIQDFTNFTPGLQYSSNLDRASIRGVGRLTNRLSGDAAVATYSDGLYTTSVAEAGKSPLFVDRVEVLRGPQGTLYGRNSIAGAINVISKRPTKEPYAEVRAGVGAYGFQNVEGAISGPITDTFRARLAATLTLQDGWGTNLARHEDGPRTNIWGVEGQLEKDFGKTQVWLKGATYGWNNRGGGTNMTTGHYDTAYSPNPAGLFFNPAYGFNVTDPQSGAAISHVQLGKVTDNPQLTDPRASSSNSLNRITDRGIDIVNLQITHQFDGAELKYIGGYNSYHYIAVSDYDGVDMVSYNIPLNPSPLPSLNTCQYVAGCKPLTIFPSITFSYDENNRWTSNELTLSSTGAGPLQWIVGAYLFDEDYHNPENIMAADQPGVLSPSGAGVGNPFGGAPNPTGSLYFFDYKMNTRSAAFFGQVDWAFRPDWKITVGLRETHDFKKGYEDFRAVCFTAGCIGDPKVFGTLVGAHALDITTTLTATYSSAAAAAVRGVVSPVQQVSATSFVNYAINPATGLARRYLKDDYSATTGTFGVQWEPSNDTNAYFRYGRGYKAGGFNAGEITASPDTLPEHVDAFEFGLKQRVTPKLTVNTAVYSYQYSDLQIPIGVFNGAIVQSQFFNVPSSTSKGVEVEATWLPIPRSLVTLSYSYNDAHVTSGCSAAGGCVQDANDPNGQEANAQVVVKLASGAALQSLKGNSLPYAPKNKIAISGTYTWLIGKGLLSGTASWFWRDEAYSTVFQREYNRAPSWDQTDLRLVYRPENRNWTITAYMRNAFDQLTYPAPGGGSRLTPNPATPTQLNSNVVKSLGLNPPRNYGISVFYRFF